MTTNVPQPTFGATGFIAPSGPAILAGVQADINGAFGNVLNYALTTPQGQLASSEAAVIANVYAVFSYYTQQVDPAYAVGRMQDAIARIYFLERNPSEPTVLQIDCVGLAGVVIPLDATIQDSAGNLYRCTGAGTIAVTGTVTLSFACTEPGPTVVPDAGDVSIYQAIPGWDSVSVASGVVGVAVESRSAFEQRRRDSVAGNSFGPVGAIIGAVAKVSGVLDYYGIDNPTAGTVTVGGVAIPAYSTYIAVAGGAAADVAAAIFSKKSPGSPLVGDTSVVVYDENPLYAAPIPYTIKFQIPDDLQILFKVVIASGPDVPSDAVLQVQNALIAAFAGSDGATKARIGSVLYATRYVPPIAALGAWAQVASLGIGSANTPSAQVFGHISGNTLTVTAVTSGTLAVGQALTDPNGLIANGTYITVLGTGTGGVGTYTVNNPQTVGGATFTGTGAGTNLTVTAVTGSIGIGDVLSGTGVPGGTTVVSQTSGTPGGAGVYVTSAATTSSGASLTANSRVVGSIATQSLVSVQIDQSPQLTASNITVSLS